MAAVFHLLEKFQIRAELIGLSVFNSMQRSEERAAGDKGGAEWL